MLRLLKTFEIENGSKITNKKLELLEVQHPKIKRLQKQSVQSIENLNNCTLPKCFLIVLSDCTMSDFSLNHFLTRVTSDVLELKEAPHSQYFEISAEPKIFIGKHTIEIALLIRWSVQHLTFTKQI